MQEKRELMEVNEHLTDAKIMGAIQYLDPDLCVEKTGDDPGTAAGICIALLAAITGALTIICLHIRTI